MSKSFEKKEEWFFDHIALRITHTVTSNIYELSQGKNGGNVKKLLSSSEEKEFYPLREISLEELKDIRKNRNGGFVYKKNSLLFYCIIPRNVRISKTTLAPHICAPSDSSLCARLASLPDPDGCKKVRDQKKQIENYSWILEGYQFFNCVENGLHVAKCDHYLLSTKSKKDFITKRKSLEILKDLYYN